MKINNIELVNYRNYNHFFIEFNDDINILIGNNGQGKTNLIEAIYLLSLGRSFKTHINKQMIMFSKEYGRIKSQIYSGNKNKNLEIILGEDFKVAKVDGRDILKISEYVGYLNVVVFIPDDLSIVKGSPSNRRRFINIELSKISPIYIHNLSKYNNLLKERNKYLKLINKGDEYLEVLDEQLASLQVNLINRRINFINKLSIKVNEIYKMIASKQEEIKLDYDSFINEINEESILKVYKNSLSRDLKYKQTHQGVHKDDLKIFIDDKEAINYASQGQQRTIVLALKIGLLEIIKDEIGEYPILLLDDVLSELDDKRKTMLLNLLNNKIQTFITTTSIDGIEHQIVKKAKKIYIRDGKEDLNIGK